MRSSSPWPVHPLLFAGYFVLFLYAQNLGEVAMAEVVPVLLVAIVGAGVTLLLTGLIWRDLRQGAILVSALVVVFFGYRHVFNATADLPIPTWLPQIGWFAFVVVAVFAAVRTRERLGSVTRGLDLISGILVLLTLFSIVPHQFGQSASAAEPTAPLAILAGRAESGPKRDIWYLILDRYASDRQLSAAYGIDGHLDEWLSGHSFYVAPDSQANYVKTSLSLASSLNLSYLDDLAARMGPANDDHGPVFARIKDHVVGRFLRSQGYRFIQVGSPYAPTNVNPLADANPRYDSATDFAGAVYDESVIPSIARRIGLVKATPSRQRYYDIARFQWETLGGLVDQPGPKFVFAHFLLPHPPYVFNADGSFASEDDGRSAVAVADGYARQLAYTDTMVEALMTRLQALPEERRPIIVLQADEGPYPTRYNGDTMNFDWATATSAELHMKYGILNAYSLPGLADPGLYPSITPVNSFRLILGRYFGTDTPLLPDREYTSRAKLRPYDLTDITDRLAAP